MYKFKLLCKKFLDTLLWNLILRFVPQKTFSFPNGTVFVIAPHPDDETLACGATIARLVSEGKKIRIIFVSDGAFSTLAPNQTPAQLGLLRQQEALQATAALGVPREDVVFLSYPDGALSKYLDSITQDLAHQIQFYTPSLILSPHEQDAHPDHQRVAQCLSVLAKKNLIKCPLQYYLVWIPTKRGLFCLKHMILKQRQIKIPTENSLQIKKTALAAYVSQTGGINHKDKKGYLSSYFISFFLKPYEIFFENKT